MEFDLPLLLARDDRRVADFLSVPWGRWKAHRHASALYVVENMLAIDPTRAVE